MRRHPLTLAAALVACFTVFSEAARAEGPSEAELAAARADFAVGVEHADAGSWDAAVVAFRRVIEVMPAPAVRLNLATALTELGRYAEAAPLLEGLTADFEASEEHQARAEALLERLRATGGRVRFSAEGAEAVLVDGYAIGPDAFAEGVLLRAGTHLVESHRGGKIVARRRVEVVEGGELKVTFGALGAVEEEDTQVSALVAEAAPARESTGRERPAWVRNKWVWIGVSAAVVLGVGLGVGLAASGGDEPHVGDFNPGQLRW